MWKLGRKGEKSPLLYIHNTYVYISHAGVRGLGVGWGGGVRGLGKKKIFGWRHGNFGAREGA